MAASREEIVGLFNKMSSRFDPKKAEGINAVIQFDLSGENGGQYWLKIADQQMETGEGTTENPRMTLLSTADDLYNVFAGTLNPMQAFMTGKLKIKGDTSLALKLMPLLNG